MPKGLQASCYHIATQILNDVEIVLVDGHQMAVSATLARQAQAQNIPVVLDGGSWKPGLETVFAFCELRHLFCRLLSTGL